ncbi:MAG: hypothetical protein AAGG11_22185 [Pseudomonadota bacterium]
MRRVGFAGVAAGVGLAVPGSGALAAGAQNPDPARIRPRGTGFRVLPTGGDDRPNIEWALCNTQPGGTVKLVEGTYKMGSTAIVPDFDGKLVGEGEHKTTITCTDEFSFEVWEQNGKVGPRPAPFPRRFIDGSSTKTAPGLIFFYKTPINGRDPESLASSIEIRNLRCRGAMIGEEWTFGDEVLCFTVINTVDWNDVNTPQAPTRQDFTLANVLVDGFSSEAFGVYENGCACITITGAPVLTDNYDLTGATDGDAFGASNGALLGTVPAPGDVTFRNCTFVNCRLGPGVVGHKDSELVFDNIKTRNCRGNCLQIIDNSNCDVVVRDCNLRNDSFLLPPELTAGGGLTDIPSSLGCIAVFSGFSNGAGIPSNLRFLTLAVDPAARAVLDEGLQAVAGPIGTWRPQGTMTFNGLETLPQPSRVRIVDSRCVSPGTLNSYCIHAIDIANVVFGVPTLDMKIRRNRCIGSQTCISLEHVVEGVVRDNRCRALETGVELYDARDVRLRDNRYRFSGSGEGCEVRTLALGEKIDSYRVVPGAGSCARES